MTASTLALAGGMEGGGGKSVVCRDPQGKITKAEILDLFEGRTQYQLKYVESQLPWKDQVIDLFQKSGISAKPSINYEIFDWYQNAIKYLNILPINVTLKDTNDSFEVVAPKGCNIEQTAIYQNDNQILINGEIWNALSETQKATLLIHESSYRFLRVYGETNSIRARHFTAYILSGGKIEDTFTDRKDAKAICAVPGFAYNTSFLVFPSYLDENGIKKAKIQFINIGGREVLSKSVAEIDLRFEEWELWEELVNPTRVFAQDMNVKSLFESGDSLTLWGMKNETVKTEISITGTSSINGSHFSSNLKCFPLL